MMTVTVPIGDNVYQRLIDRARQTGQSVEIVAAELLQRATTDLVADPLEAWIGAIDSGTDWADNHDVYLGQQSAVHLKW